MSEKMANILDISTDQENMANISDFSTDEVFRFLEDLKNLIQNIARSQGYVTVTKRSKTTTFKFKSKVFFRCDRSAKYLKAQDGWKLQVVRDDHNHEPSMYMEGHSIAMRLLDKETRLVHDLTKLNVKPLDILSTIKQQNENNILRYLDEKVEARYKMSCTFCILKAFPYVVLMDATYKTSKYNLIFLEIVGVTSTRLTWALTCLKLTINDFFCPRVIVTDRDLALMKACEDIFPQSNHLVCRKRIKSDKNWGSVHPMWKKLVESPTPSQYMQVCFGYLYNTWLEKYPDKFVSLWPDKSTNFGNSTTNRVDSQHAKLAYRKRDLDKFIYVIETVVQSQDTTIKESFTWSTIICKPKFEDEIFSSLRHHVSEHALDKILEELHQLKEFVPTPENCGCQLRTCFGLPCAHELAMYVDAGSPIPLDSIDIFWRTLDFKPCVFVDYGNLNVDDHMRRWKEKFNNQPDHVEYSYIRKMDELIDPSKITINEPSVKKNNCGCPKVKRGHHQNLNQEPPRHSSSFFDLNDEPARHSSPFFDLNDESTRHNSSFFDLNDEPTGHNSSFFDLNDEPSRHSSFFMGMNEEPIDQCSYQFDLNEEPTCQWSYRFDLKEEAPMQHSSLLKEIP
uniref:Protein FAR1-RELATED SEQUENCE n=1 Tax=Lactuca sativa TaxID=4236 RepID=A0A9R1W029_LACSA|nr:hypothetical protein LSAT_V11C400162320 [Lactuca sativa]